MDTIARGNPTEVAATLRELGYDGIGGTALDLAVPEAIAVAGLKFHNGYLAITLDAQRPSVEPALANWFREIAKYRTTLWLAIREVKLADGRTTTVADPESDAAAVQALTVLAQAASEHGVRIALYPHTGFWLQRFEDAVRIADRLNRPDVGVTFNLCHWLKVEGADTAPFPLIRAALPRLFFVTINGADAGDTRAMNWDRLIQPLDRGTYDASDFVRKLLALGYTGPVGLQGYGIKEDPKAVLARSMEAWRKMSAR